MGIARNTPVTGVIYLLRGFGLIMRPHVLRYALIPISLNMLLFSFLIFFGFQQVDRLIDWLIPALPDWLEWLEWFFWLVFAISSLMVVFFTFTLVANIVSSPFNGMLAEAVEHHLTGKRPGPGNRSLLTEIVMAVGSELRKTGYLLLRAVPLLALFLVPGINLLAPWLWLAFSAWGLAMEYSDYPLGNHGMNFAMQRGMLRKKRFVVLGFGAAVLAATVIPLVNFVVIPAAVAGATALWVEHGNHQESGERI